MLKVDGIEVYYGDLQALRQVSLEVNDKEVITIVGSNGAGKSTTLMTLSGILHPRRGEIYFRGRPIHRAPSSKIVEMGIVQIPEGRQLFPTLTVAENLEMGARFARAKKARNETMEWVLQLFPRLRERKKQFAGTLSGGEQQMLAIGRGLMSRPELLMLDEPSLGLAPLMVREVFKVIKEINTRGKTILLVEQSANLALKASEWGFILENGRVALAGKTSELRNQEKVRKIYLGEE